MHTNGTQTLQTNKDRQAQHKDGEAVRTMGRNRIGVLSVLVLAAIASMLGFAASASAAQPWWELTTGSRPANLALESEGEIVVTAENLGDASIEGATSPASIVDTLPPGLKALGIAATTRVVGELNLFGPGARVSLPCSLALLTCTLNTKLPPYEQVELRIKVRVEPNASESEVNRVSVTGGGTPPVSSSH